MTPDGVIAELISQGLTLSTAESLTGGDLASTLTSVPGASAAYAGGLVAYATRVKVDLLGVEPDTIDRVGAVSSECAIEMATGARALVGSSLAVSTTGVAGPDRQEGKPAGLAFIAVAWDEGFTVRELRAEGSRSEVRDTVVRCALELLEETVRGIAVRAVGSEE